MIDPDRPCPHERFEAWAGVNRLTAHEGGPVIGYAADVRVRCADCAEPFKWVGVPTGSNPHRPCSSLDGHELRAPLRPSTRLVAAR